MMLLGEKKCVPYLFDAVHPTVLFGSFAAVIVLTMATMNLLLLLVSFAGALALSVWVRGWRATGTTLVWQIPLVVLCAVINPLFASTGSIELFRIGTKAIYLESVVTGAATGLMLVSIMLWFSLASQILTSDKILTIIGKRMPTMGLIISMTLRLVPRLVERGRHIDSAVRATTVITPRTIIERIAARLRIVSVLMGWSMEDSLETADAMRARGWGAVPYRTSYRPYRFRIFDAAIGIAILAILITLVVLIRGIS
ncbi:MAG: energy-coupling factor transporter transmembrane protein EcfT [Coriobacteriia bacterium]|nr:energy-coupling factor transporter transmembrane protein EcfT [Coriobacteriia bacterium]